MKDKKLQVFVSSTYTDLIEERQAAVEAILSSGNIPAGMELFAAGDESQMSVIERWIDESDIYLLILGGRYGSIDLKTGKSYTELEYDYAVSKSKSLFSVVISQNALDEKVKTQGRAAIEQENNKELNLFRSKVLNNLIKFWDDKKDIKIAIHETLSDFAYRKELSGWVRGDNSINTGFLAEEIARLTKENSELRTKLLELNITDTSLYANLTYTQLEQLLKREIVDLNGSSINLFDFLMSNGQELSIGYVDDGFSEEENRLPYEKLMLYKLVNEVGDRIWKFKFTEDGHNFYLKALLLSTSE